jgi:hypothetical protein
MVIPLGKQNLGRLRRLHDKSQKDVVVYLMTIPLEKQILRKQGKKRKDKKQIKRFLKVTLFGKVLPRRDRETDMTYSDLSRNTEEKEW